MGQTSSSSSSSKYNNSSMISPSDLGLTSSETIKIEHVFTLKLGDAFFFKPNSKWERPLRKAAEAMVDVGYHWAESFRILAMGVSAYFVLSGLAHLVQATIRTDAKGGSSNSSSRKGGTSSSTRSTRGTSSTGGRSSSKGTTTVTLSTAEKSKTSSPKAAGSSQQAS